MTWNDIFWYGTQAFFAVLCVWLFIEQGRLRSLVNYLISERNGLHGRCNLLEVQVDKLAFTLNKGDRPEGSYRDNAVSGSNEEDEGDDEEDDDEEDDDPHEKPFVLGQVVEVKFDDDGYPAGSGPWFHAIFAGITKDADRNSMVKLKFGDELSEFRFSDIIIMHPTEGSHV